MSFVELQFHDGRKVYLPNHKVASIEILPTEEMKHQCNIKEHHGEHVWYIEVFYERRSKQTSWYHCGFSTEQEAKNKVENMIYGTSRLKAERDMAVELLTKRLQDRCDDLFTDVTQQDQV